MNLTESLEKIGLSDKEAQVYLQLIRLGAQPASVISRNANINRTTGYDILESLTKRGLIRSMRKKGATVFESLHPKELISYLEREKNENARRIEKQKESISEILPMLISLEKPTSSRPKVTFFEGEKGMREAYEDTLTSKGNILAYANVEEMHKGLPYFFPEYYKRRGKEKKIHIKAIVPDNSLGVERAGRDKAENRETVMVSKKDFDFSPEINIYNNKVLMVSWREKMAIIIESDEIADFHRKMYRLAWERAKERRKK